MDEKRILWIISQVKALIARTHRDLEAGTTTSVVMETSLREVDRFYRHLCGLESLQPINHMLEAPSVEMQARYALDALFSTIGGVPDEAMARAAFWQSFRQVTRPRASSVA